MLLKRFGKFLNQLQCRYQNRLEQEELRIFASSSYNISGQVFSGFDSAALALKHRVNNSLVSTAFGQWVI